MNNIPKQFSYIFILYDCMTLTLVAIYGFDVRSDVIHSHLIESENENESDASQISFQFQIFLFQSIVEI